MRKLGAILSIAFSAMLVMGAARMPINRGYLQSNLNGNTNSITNLQSVVAVLFVGSLDITNLFSASGSNGYVLTLDSGVAKFLPSSGGVEASTNGVISFMGRDGSIVLLSSDVTNALGFLPVSLSVLSNTVSPIAFFPTNSFYPMDANPSNFTSVAVSSNLSWLITKSNIAVSSVNGRTGAVTIVFGDITNALGSLPLPTTTFNSATGSVWTAIHGKAGTNEQTMWLTELYGGTYVRGGPLRVYTEVENPGTWKINEWGEVWLSYVVASNFVGTIGLSNVLGDGAVAGQVPVWNGVQFVPTTVTPPESSTNGVLSFNSRDGFVTLLLADITAALGYTPYNAANPDGYITASAADSIALTRSMEATNGLAAWINSKQDWNANLDGWSAVSTNILGSLQSQIDDLTSNTNGITSMVASNLAFIEAQKATNGLGTMAWKTASDYSTTTQMRTEIQSATNNLDGSKVIAGTISPLRLSTNTFLVASENISIQTNYSGGMTTYIISSTATSSGSGYWDETITLTTNAPAGPYGIDVDAKVFSITAHTSKHVEYELFITYTNSIATNSYFVRHSDWIKRASGNAMTGECNPTIQQGWHIDADGNSVGETLRWGQSFASGSSVAYRIYLPPDATYSVSLAYRSRTLGDP